MCDQCASFHALVEKMRAAQARCRVGRTFLSPDAREACVGYEADVDRELARRREAGPSEPDEVRRLQRIIDGLAARVAAQAELLAARAEKGATPCPAGPR